MKLIDTDHLTETCSICGRLIDTEIFPEPIILIGGGKITFAFSPGVVANNLSVMHRDCYYGT